MSFWGIYERVCNCFQLSCLIDILTMSCLYKTIWRKFEKLLKMYCVHCVKIILFTKIKGIEHSEKEKEQNAEYGLMYYERKEYDELF